MRATAIGIAVLIGMSGCSVASDNAARRCAGADTDLSKEPEYSANYLHRATRDRCDVRLDVLMLTRPGADFHCAPWPPTIVTGTPLGEPHSTQPRVYVRDPEGWLHDGEVTAGFDRNAGMPSAAKQSRYRIDSAKLWTVEDGGFIFLRYDDRTERWPLDSSPPGCA